MKPILLLTFLFSPVLGYSQELPKETLPLLRTAFPSADLSQSQWAAGDLNGDGLEDLALIVFHQIQNKESRLPVEMERLVVLLRSRESFQLAAQSRDWESHERRGDSVRIAKGVLVLSMEGASSCCAHYSQEFKFKLRDGVFLLIGEESFESGMSVTDDKEYSSRKSVNYLTRQVIYLHKTAGEKAAPDVKLRFQDEPLQLSNFSYFTYLDHFRSKELKRP